MPYLAKQPGLSQPGLSQHPSPRRHRGVFELFKNGSLVFFPKVIYDWYEVRIWDSIEGRFAHELQFKNMGELRKFAKLPVQRTIALAANKLPAGMSLTNGCEFQVME